MNFRIAITPSGVPHIGNNIIILINYILKTKLISNIFLRFDDTNQKKNKLINKFFIIKNLKKNGIFLKKILKQTNFTNFYKKKIFFLKKNYYKKYYFNNKIKKKNLNYSNSIILNNCYINFVDNNYGNLNFSIFFENNIIIKKTNISTYNYSTIIDDYYNDIFIILRGKEWMNQIPIQLILCKKKNFLFQFNHILNIVFFNEKKISKRNLKKKYFLNLNYLKIIKKNIINKNKNIKLLILEKFKKNLKKINNYIMINLLNIINSLDNKIIINFIKIKIFFLKNLKLKLNFSNINYFNKIFKEILNIFSINKINFIINKIKNYEFI